jgi:hypothetical protein
MAEQSLSSHGSQEAERQKGDKDEIHLSQAYPRVLLPPTRPHLLIIHSVWNSSMD